MEDSHGRCLTRCDLWFRYAKLGHLTKECKDNDSRPQAQTQIGTALGPSSGGQCNNRFYALHTICDMEKSPYVWYIVGL